MKLLKKVTNGILLIVIGIMHIQFALSADCFGNQFKEFARTYFFKVHRGLEDMPFVTGHSNMEAFAAFWFFYFGVLIIPLGLLVHSYERKNTILPHTFTLTYLLVVLLGCYMVPSSGMTYIMLPHAVFMVVVNYVRFKKKRLSISRNVLSSEHRDKVYFGYAESRKTTV
jgi:hypothetical protein